jgi:hypothetical protein
VLVPALLAAAMVLTGVSAPVSAEPGSPGVLDDEGGTATLRTQLDAAARGYLDAAAALDRSQQRQQDLTAQLATVQSELATRSAAVDEIASVAYRTGRLGALSAMLGAQSPDLLLDRALALNAVAANENTALRHLVDTRDRATRARTAIDAEVAQQQRHLAVMADRKKQAERALAAAAAASRVRASQASGVPSSGARQATPAPRNPDGSWPAESCGLDDPTSSGCLTPRTLHALNQAKAAGFTRYVSCHRSGGSGEHPKGRACDFAAQQGGFGGAATGGDRTYGNNLAAFFVANASRLGVLYVIWYRQIWLPGTGWRSYSGSGSPSAEHTNHVHLSVY